MNHLIYSQSSGNLELGIGYHQPQAQFSKYVDPGYSLRVMYSKNSTDWDFIKYDFGIQYLQFKREVWYDSFQLVSGDSGPEIEVVNSEKSFGLLLGPRIMSPTKKGFIRPYTGIKGGFFRFSETITWDWGQDGSFQYDSDDEDWDYHEDQTTATKTLDSMGYFGWLLEFGSNFAVKDRFGIDFNIQYNVIPGLEKPEFNATEIPDTNIIKVGTISNKIDADYIAINLGVIIPLTKKKSH